MPLSSKSFSLSLNEKNTSKRTMDAVGTVAAAVANHALPRAHQFYQQRRFQSRQKIAMDNLILVGPFDDCLPRQLPSLCTLVVVPSPLLAVWHCQHGVDSHMQPTPIPTQEELELINEINVLVQKTKTDYEKLLKHYKVKSNSEMTIEQLKDAKKLLEQKL